MDINTASQEAPPRRNTRVVVDRSRWISEGLVVLGAEGIDAVRVEVLAKRLGVTKGSFYWHFKDRDDLLAGMLAEWRRSTTTAVVESLWGKPISPRDKLSRLWRICFSDRVDNPGGVLEAALRNWSLVDKSVADMIATVDRERIAFCVQIYREMNVPNPEGFAYLWHSYVVGRNTLAIQGFKPDHDLELAAKAALLVIDP
jgi:AcrR family transcriptional regulator